MKILYKKQIGVNELFFSVVGRLIGWTFTMKKDRFEFRRICNDIDSMLSSKIIRARYPKLIKHLQDEFSKRKLKVVFLNSENPKWVYRFLYDEFKKNQNFQVQVLITVRDGLLKKKYKFLEYEKLANDNFNFFKKDGLNVDYAFDFKKKKHIDLKKFNPDIVFYEQPWELPKKYRVNEVSKYALPFYCSYGSCITNGINEYSEPFYKDVYVYFIDNVYIKKVLLEHGCQQQAIVVSGQPKLDVYLKPINQSNIIWKSVNKKRVIYAPHHSFYKNSVLGFGTFDWNYKFFFNFAKNHPEIEFIIKPHPELKRQIVKRGLMSANEMIQYFKMWESLPNAQIYEFANYFDMFKTSDLLITDCNSFLYEYLPTKKPVIHLIGKNSVGHNEYGQKITSGYYLARDIEELKAQLELVLFNGHDPLKLIREQIIKNDLIQPKIGVAKFILNYITQLLRKEINA